MVVMYTRNVVVGYTQTDDEWKREKGKSWSCKPG